MGYRIEDTGIRWNGRWRHMRVPLRDFEEMGSWDNGTFFDQVGEYDWKAVQEFEIVAEQQGLAGIELWFDKIQVNNVVITGTEEPHLAGPPIRIYPNPTIGQKVNIKFKIHERASGNLTIYSITGEKVISLVNGILENGTHQLTWDLHNPEGQPVSRGLYFCTLQTSQMMRTQKFIIHY